MSMKILTCCNAMPLAGEVKLCNGERRDGAATEVALRLLPQPKLRQVVSDSLRGHKVLDNLGHQVF